MANPFTFLRCSRDRLHPLRALVLTWGLLLLWAGGSQAQPMPAPVSTVEIPTVRNDLRPDDFQPLTSLPWSDADTPLHQVLERIFLEPDEAIRYAVLAAYLRSIPVAAFEQAFDACIALEGEQQPDRLIAFLLPIWAGRDAEGCWRKVRGLFDLIFMPHVSWLGIDDWGTTRPPIEVPNPDAVRQSSYRISERALTTFATALKKSDLPRERRVSILLEFAVLCLDHMHALPADNRPDSRQYQLNYGVVDALGLDESSFSGPTAMRWLEVSEKVRDFSDYPRVEILRRRVIAGDPSRAPEIILADTGKTSPPAHSLLQIWAQADYPAMLAWAEADDPELHLVKASVKGWLMVQVDEATRQRWLDEVSADPSSPDRWHLLKGWAARDPAAALAHGDEDTLEMLLSDMVQGPYGSHTSNTWHFGLGVLRHFDFSAIPGHEQWPGLLETWHIFMEFWGDVDIGECARFGVDFLWSYDYADRENILDLFGGDDTVWFDGCVVDRTFCALRVWAVWRPEEMKRWIDGIGDEELRAALTWLQANPWGHGNPIY